MAATSRNWRYSARERRPANLARATKEEPSASPRPLLLSLISHIVNRSNQHLIIWKLDRLARIPYEQEMIIELFKRHGVTLHSVQVSERELLKDGGSLSDDPSRALFRTMMAAVAQYERAVIALRTRTGAQMKASRGGWAGGCVPYGYRRTDKRDIEIDPMEAEVVRWIFYLREQLFASFDEIGKELTRRGFKGPWYKTKIHRIYNSAALYQGNYTDPFTHQPHARPDLRILPASLTTWAEERQAPTEIDESNLERMPAYGEDEEA